MTTSCTPNLQDTQKRVEIFFKQGLSIEQIAEIVGWREDRVQSFCEGLILTKKESEHRLSLTTVTQEQLKQSLLTKKLKRSEERRDTVADIDGKIHSSIRKAVEKLSQFVDDVEVVDTKDAEKLIKVVDSMEKLHSRITQAVDQEDMTSLENIQKNQLFEMEIHKTTVEIHEESADGLVHLEKGKRPKPRVTETSERRKIKTLGAQPIIR